MLLICCYFFEQGFDYLIVPALVDEELFFLIDPLEHLKDFNVIRVSEFPFDLLDLLFE